MLKKSIAFLYEKTPKNTVLHTVRSMGESTLTSIRAASSSCAASYIFRLSKVLKLFLKSLRTKYSNRRYFKIIRARDRAIDHASAQINGHNDDGHRHVQPGVVRHHQSQYIQIFHCFMLMLQCLRRGIVS